MKNFNKLWKTIYIGIDYHEIPIEEPIATFSHKRIIRPSKRFNGNICECCGKPVDSENKVVKVCNKCAFEYQFWGKQYEWIL